VSILALQFAPGFRLRFILFLLVVLARGVLWQPKGVNAWNYLFRCALGTGLALSLFGLGSWMRLFPAYLRTHQIFQLLLTNALLLLVFFDKSTLRHENYTSLLFLLLIFLLALSTGSSSSANALCLALRLSLLGLLLADFSFLQWT
jgi:hypothetical protein